jgi:hypothetical protein
MEEDRSILCQDIQKKTSGRSYRLCDPAEFKGFEKDGIAKKRG